MITAFSRSKPELTEAEKIAETAHKIKEGIWLGYHKRKTDDYKIEKLSAYLLEIVSKWETKYLSETPK
jgi:hypothetical protein